MVERRRIGASSLEVAPLALGGNVFGWTADERTSFAILDAFVAAGGTMIDTADVYSSWVPGHSGGESETVIGRWLKRSPDKRQAIVIATKVGFSSGLSKQTIHSSCEQSLQRLGIDTIDLYYHHKDDLTVPLEESLGAMDTLVGSGKVREIGLSQYSSDRLESAMRTIERNGFHRACALQSWYNLVDRDRLEGPLRDVAIASGLGIIPFYGLANGFLTGKYRSRTDLSKSTRGDRVADYLQGKGLRVLEALDEIHTQTGASRAAIALAWANAQPGVVATLASATSVAQLAELTSAMDLELSPHQLDILEAASAETGPIAA
jgi:aryl-alcohol dehydrogenase-like predicted oxidoreductase